MRYPFAIIIGSLCVFAFIGLMIASGELRWGAPIPSATIRDIATVSAQCAHTHSAIYDAAYSSAKPCAGQQSCELTITPAAELPRNCTQSFTVIYRCAGSVAPASEHRRTLYQGQQAIIGCGAS